MARKTQRTETDIEDITHDESKRVNIPTAQQKSFVGDTQKAPVKIAYEKRNPDLDPQLIWHGKYDADDTLTVKAPPLYIQEKVHPKAIIEDMREERKPEKEQFISLFADFNGMPQGVEKTDFYKHEQNWTNRMILGDSLQVMGSLSEREGLKGKVQAIYFDPPYGIKFNSNFQFSTNHRDVKDGKLENITREPEQVKAFRDTWENGIHSYLSYLRDRFIVARDLLTESGSIFVQIGDENVHHLRELMDEIFGQENFINTIVIKKKGSTLITESVFDYVIWYAKNKETVKVNTIYEYKPSAQNDERFTSLISPYGQIVSSFSLDEKELTKKIETGWKYARVGYPIVSQHLSDTRSIDFIFRGKSKNCGKNAQWRFDVPNGLKRLGYANRLYETNGSSLGGIVFYNDRPFKELGNLWENLGGAANPIYVVQTNNKITQRCLLMATDPGDIVLDPTCGSGTTAYVAEQWGRRWITIDTSRVALALARARLMGAKYPYYLMADSKEGAYKESEITQKPPAQGPFGNNINLGFVYNRVPHITLKSIANNSQIDEIWNKWQKILEPLRDKLNKITVQTWEEWEIPIEVEDKWNKEAKSAHADWWKARIARQKEIDDSIAAKADFELLYDKPLEDRKKVRVSGPFTVESISPYHVLNIDENDNLIHSKGNAQMQVESELESADFTTMIIDNLKAAGVQQSHKDSKIIFDSIEHFTAGNLICAEGRYTEGDETRRAAIFIGPEFGTVSREDIIDAAREAGDEKFDILIACAFNFEASAGELDKRGKMPILKARMNADLHMSKELKKTDKGNLFVVFGEPDIEILREKDDKIRVKIKGVDVYNPSTGRIESDNENDIACWFIDTDYNAESFFVRQAYFVGQSDPYDSLRRALNADIAKETWESLHSTISRAFPKPASKRIAVKVINHLGDEVMKVFKIE